MCFLLFVTFLFRPILLSQESWSQLKGYLHQSTHRWVKKQCSTKGRRSRVDRWGQSLKHWSKSCCMVSRGCKHGHVESKFEVRKCTTRCADYAWPCAKGRKFLQKYTISRASKHDHALVNFHHKSRYRASIWGGFSRFLGCACRILIQPIKPKCSLPFLSLFLILVLVLIVFD